MTGAGCWHAGSMRTPLPVSVCRERPVTWCCVPASAPMPQAESTNTPRNVLLCATSAPLHGAVRRERRVCCRRAPNRRAPRPLRWAICGGPRTALGTPETWKVLVLGVGYSIWAGGPFS